jgi:hypothetical protein
LDKDYIEAVEYKAVLQILSLWGCLQKNLPQDSKPPRFHWLLKIHKVWVPLMPIVSTSGAITYHLSEYVMGLIGFH